MSQTIPTKTIAGIKDAKGTRGKNSIKNDAKIIASTIANIKTEGINIAIAIAKTTKAKYAATYPLMLVTCLPLTVMVVPIEKLITDTSKNITSTINSTVFFLIS